MNVMNNRQSTSKKIEADGNILDRWLGQHILLFYLIFYVLYLDLPILNRK